MFCLERVCFLNQLDFSSLQRYMQWPLWNTVKIQTRRFKTVKLKRFIYRCSFSNYADVGNRITCKRGYGKRWNVCIAKRWTDRVDRPYRILRYVNHLLETTHIPRSPIPAVAGVLRGMNGFISVAEVRAEPKQPGFITVHTMVAQLRVQCRTFLGMEPWVHTTNWLSSMTTIIRTSMSICM